ncbi:MAG: chorismate synthase [Sphingobacteriaceae bacterium]|nr:chorismate synthase [Sphingobacteriaceae bacterium]
MAGNSIGIIFKLTSFGESHGAAIGGIIDGCPAGLKIDISFVQSELNRRRPGQSEITSERNEEDQVEFLSGIADGISLGTPIAFLIRNKDSKSEDYTHLDGNYRPGHADYTYQMKYGIREHRGGGRSSARETISRIVAGAIAKQILHHKGIQINAFVKQVHQIKTEKHYSELNFNEIEKSIVRCPDSSVSKKMEDLILKTKQEGDSVGGIIQCVVQNVPVGLGEPVFNKLHAQLGHAMLGINAVKGFEFGEGFNAVYLKGSEMNDVFVKEGDQIKTNTNHSGGIQGGISNGMPIYFNVAFKAVSTIMMDQKSVDSNGNEIILKAKGRHDPCVLPRAVPIVESMTALVMVDFLLQVQLNKI